MQNSLRGRYCLEKLISTYVRTNVKRSVLRVSLYLPSLMAFELWSFETQVLSERPAGNWMLRSLTASLNLFPPETADKGIYIRMQELDHRRQGILIRAGIKIQRAAQVVLSTVSSIKLDR